LDDSKLLNSAPTLRWLLERGARVVVAGHLDLEARTKPSIEACGLRLAELLEVEMVIPDENLGPITNKLLREQRSGQVILLENLALDAGEVDEDEDYARRLAEPFDIYVADALFAPLRFASLTLVPKFCEARVMGLRLQAELSQLHQVVGAGATTTWVMDGSFSDLRATLERALDRKSQVLVGSRLGATLLAASGGRCRPCADDVKLLSRAKSWLADARSAGLPLVLPKDFVCEAKSETLQRGLDDLRPDENIVDLGSRTLEHHRSALERASRVVMLDGVGLDAEHYTGTQQLLEAMRDRHAGNYVLLDATVSAALSKLDDDVGSARVGFVSSAREAVLAILHGQKLPALDALRIPR
jgi:phosphoglycerate kinase